jgi:hypothetical protein
VKKFCSIDEFEVESKVASLRVRRKIEGESIEVAKNVSNPSF